jgi:hypothetical protein
MVIKYQPTPTWLFASRTRIPNMLKQKTIAIYQIVERFIKENFSLILCISILIAAVGMTFVWESGIVGFERGYDELAPKHHGSVSSKTLAIITTATWENHFVGYAVRYKDDQNTVSYDYFDRYPVFFSAVFNRILALRPKLSSKIYLARQVMNFFFVATLVVAFLLCDKLIKNKPLSLTAVLFAFSNPYLLFYKDMVHFDQPALFGFLLLTYTIALYKIDGLRWPMYIATFLAIALGRGYASYAVLGLWLLIEAFLILKTKAQSFGQKIRDALKHPSFHLMMIGILWGASLLSYNIIIEAQTRHISILQTSIIDSAGRRLALNQKFNEANEDLINWPDYIRGEISRIVKWASPIKWAKPQFFVSLVLLVGMCLIMGIVIRRQPIEKRIVFILLALAGVVWMTLMRNLAAFHDYTTMYFIGITLVFFISVLVLLKPSKDAAYYLVLMGLVVYLSALSQVRDLHEFVGRNASEYTYDFMRIENALNSKGNNIYLASGIPNGPNAAEFYMPDQYLAPLALSEYAISDNLGYSPENLTPNNKFMYLFKIKK